MAARRRAPLPERPRRYRFALTPLADAMFQLLIFFMLSSSLAPYSLITIKSAAPGTADSEESSGQGAGDGPAPASNAAGPTLWTVGKDIVTTGGQTYRIDQMVELAEALGTQDNPANVVILVREDARIQDVATAMEALERAEITGVQITKDGS